jgi:hypothetical protein
MQRRDITYAEWLRVAPKWLQRCRRGESIVAPARELALGYFAFVDGVLYRYVG